MIIRTPNVFLCTVQSRIINVIKNKKNIGSWINTKPIGEGFPFVSQFQQTIIPKYVKNSIVNDILFFIFFQLIPLVVLLRSVARLHTRLAAWRSGGGTQKLGRATNFQIPAKLSASIHPD